MEVHGPGPFIVLNNAFPFNDQGIVEFQQTLRTNPIWEIFVIREGKFTTRVFAV